jgi:multisubunit Na+/H+ antiporter MnhG subunit
MLDLRLPMGLMFTIVGAILTIYGAVTFNQPDIYKCSLGINIDLWWGAVLTLFGAAMLFMAWRAKPAPDAKDEKPPKRD